VAALTNASTSPRCNVVGASPRAAALDAPPTPRSASPGVRRLSVPPGSPARATRFDRLSLFARPVVAHLRTAAHTGCCAGESATPTVHRRRRQPGRQPLGTCSGAGRILLSRPPREVAKSLHVATDYGVLASPWDFELLTSAPRLIRSTTAPAETSRWPPPSTSPTRVTDAGAGRLRGGEGTPPPAPVERHRGRLQVGGRRRRSPTTASDRRRRAPPTIESGSAERRGSQGHAALDVVDLGHRVDFGVVTEQSGVRPDGRFYPRRTSPRRRRTAGARR